MKEESDSHSSQSQKKISIPDSSPSWGSLGSDLTEIILSNLPIPSIIRATSVCKFWNSIIHSNSFKTQVSNDSKRLPWLFLSGQNKNSSNNKQLFAFDPESNKWIKLQNKILLSEESFTASNGFIFFTCSEKFSFGRVLSGTWGQTSPLRFPRCNPLIGLYNDEQNRSRFFVAGGVNGERRLAVEIYNPHRDSWEFCPPLPEFFRLGNSLELLSSALFKGKLYVLMSTYSNFVSSFDLENRFWSDVRTLKPPGMQFSRLVSCQDMLILAGLCNNINNDLEFNLWRIDEKTLEFSEIGIMPPDLLISFIDNIENGKLAKFRCVGFRNIVYVLDEEIHPNWSACVCEISDSGKCTWRRVPNLPGPVNGFHKVTSFCGNVSLLDVLGNERD